jgi:hypothetical protein
VGGVAGEGTAGCQQGGLKSASWVINAQHTARGRKQCTGHECKLAAKRNRAGRLLHGGQGGAPHSINAQVTHHSWQGHVL